MFKNLRLTQVSIPEMLLSLLKLTLIICKDLSRLEGIFVMLLIERFRDRKNFLSPYACLKSISKFLKPFYCRSMSTKFEVLRIEDELVFTEVLEIFPALWY